MLDRAHRAAQLRRPVARDRRRANAAQLGRVLAAGTASTPLATSTANGRTDRDRLADVVRRSARRTGSPAVRPAPARSPSRTSRRSRRGAPRVGVEQMEVGVERPQRLESASLRTCAALITRQPVRRAASAQNAGPSSPCSWSIVRPSASAVCATSSSVGLTNTPTSSARRLSAAAISAPSSGRTRRGEPREDQADRPGAQVGGALGVRERGEPADLDLRGNRRHLAPHA